MVDQVEKLVPAAAAIVDIWMGGDTAWRSRLDDSDFLESADWQNALELARATITAYNPNERLTSANHDCLAKAKPGEPMFILLGRDPDGANIVRLWARRRSDAGDPDHAGPVFAIADAMDDWRAKGNLPESAPDAANYPPIGVERLREALEEVRYVQGRLIESMCQARSNWRADARADSDSDDLEKAWTKIDEILARTSPSGLRE